MAKLTVFVVLLVALLAIAEASYRATITTTTIEEENPLEQSKCRQQVQGRPFRNCRTYLRSPYLELEEEDPENQQYEQSLRQCCQELRNVPEQCQCEAIRHVVSQQAGGGRYGGQEQQQVVQKAQSLPRLCRLRSQQCQIQAAFY